MEDDCNNKVPDFPQPVLQLHVSDVPNHITCEICSLTVLKKNSKRSGISSFKDKTKFKANALLWEPYEHVYSAVYNRVDWNKETLYGCKSCKAMFSNSKYSVLQ